MGLFQRRRYRLNGCMHGMCPRSALVRNGFIGMRGRAILSPYQMQVDYPSSWSRAVSCFRRLCDLCPSVNISIEWKPTDESSRFSIVPSTGEALRLVEQVGGKEGL